MTVNRRSFFRLAVGAAAAITLDPERGLWLPGKKLISIPRPALAIRFVNQPFSLAVGDVVTFGRDPLPWTITKVYEPGGYSMCRLQPAGDARAAAGRDTIPGAPLRRLTSLNRSHPRVEWPRAPGARNGELGTRPPRRDA